MEQRDVTGLVFDLPNEAWTAEVRRLRAAYDHDRTSFPIEITVAGSSGLGWFSPNQSLELIVNHVREFAQKRSPFRCAFAGVEVFPASQVHYLALEDETPFHEFQRSLAASALQFEPTPFAYKPHCTIVRLRADDATAQAELSRFSVPRDGVTISSVSLYSVNLAKNASHFIKRFPLGA
jgi:2'-5' RNA ligase